MNRIYGTRQYDGELDQSSKALGYGVSFNTGVREISYEGTFVNNKKHGLCAYYGIVLIDVFYIGIIRDTRFDDTHVQEYRNDVKHGKCTLYW